MQKKVVLFPRIVFLFISILFFSSITPALEFNKKWEAGIGGSGLLSYGDVNDDGKDEIVFNSGSFIRVISSDGAILKSLSLQYPGNQFAPIGLANLDKSDKELELIRVADIEGVSRLEVYKLDGRLLWKTGKTDIRCRAAPSIDDVDLDGLYEIIFPCGRLVYGFNHDGSTLEGWPVDLFEILKVQRSVELEHYGIEEFIKNYEITNIAISPAIGELDLADDNSEIVIAASQFVFTLHHDGKLYWIGWYTADNFGLGLGDINGDTILEVVVTTLMDGGVDLRENIELVPEKLNPIAYSHDGIFLWGDEPKIVTEGVSLGQFDLTPAIDGTTPTLEILVENFDFGGNNKIFIFDGYGSRLKEGKLNRPISLYTPLIADFDGDGIDEIVINGKLGGSSFSIFNNDFVEIATFGEGRASIPPVLGDIDKNNKLEVIFVSGSKLFAYESDQEMPAGKISWPMYWHDARHTANYETPQEDKLRDKFIRGDVDGNGIIDINDPVAILNFMFQSGKMSCLSSADTDDSGTIDINDVTYLLNWMFLSGSAIPQPGTLGNDLTPDKLNCVCYGAQC